MKMIKNISTIISTFLLALSMTILPVSPVFAIGDEPTARAVKILRNGAAECGRIDLVYRIDCIRQVYNRAQAPIQFPDYAGARKELRAGSRSLKKLVDKNVDRKAPVLKVNNRKYRAVKKAVVASLNREAKQIIQESATRLLRSGANSSKRRSHYAKIAKAYDSTKRILRS